MMAEGRSDQRRDIRPVRKKAVVEREEGREETYNIEVVVRWESTVPRNLTVVLKMPTSHITVDIFLLLNLKAMSS